MCKDYIMHRKWHLVNLQSCQIFIRDSHVFKGLGEGQVVGTLLEKTFLNKERD